MKNTIWTDIYLVLLGNLFWRASISLSKEENLPAEGGTGGGECSGASPSGTGSVLRPGGRRSGAEFLGSPPPEATPFCIICRLHKYWDNTSGGTTGNGLAGVANPGGAIIGTGCWPLLECTFMGNCCPFELVSLGTVCWFFSDDKSGSWAELDNVDGTSFKFSALVMFPTWVGVTLIGDFASPQALLPPVDSEDSELHELVSRSSLTLDFWPTDCLYERGGLLKLISHNWSTSLCCCTGCSFLSSVGLCMALFDFFPTITVQPSLFCFSWSLPLRPVVSPSPSASVLLFKLRRKKEEINKDDCLFTQTTLPWSSPGQASLWTGLALQGTLPVGWEKEGNLQLCLWNLNSTCNSPVAPRWLSCQISANRGEGIMNPNVNKHWKTCAKGNDIIINVTSAKQHFVSTFSMQIFKFHRRSCKLSFLVLSHCQSTPESLLAGFGQAECKSCLLKGQAGIQVFSNPPILLDLLMLDAVWPVWQSPWNQRFSTG